MTVEKMIRILEECPNQKAEVIVRMGLDSRDNPVFGFVEEANLFTVEELDSELLEMTLGTKEEVLLLTTGE